MKQFKLVFCDLDGTLLNSNKIISDENKKAISMIRERGIKFIINSGRSYMSLAPFLEQLDINKKGNIGVCYNGGIIYEADTQKTIIEHRLPKHIALDLINIIRSFNCDILVYINNSLVIEKESKDINYYYTASGLSPVIADFKSYINEDVSKVLILGDNHKLKEIWDKLIKMNIRKFCEMEFSSKNLIEFNKKGINKGSAVLDIARILNIDVSDIIAVGDNFNDLSMIKQAGLGIAVNNAADEIKSTADYVLKSDNNNHIVKEIFETFIK